jgi:hypothetical protein
MNIITYASQVALQPEPRWSLSLFKGTLSYENFLREKIGILQLLTKEQAPLVSLLGKKSGKDFQKEILLDEINEPVIDINVEIEEKSFPFRILQHCPKFIVLNQNELLIENGVNSNKINSGDHDIILCNIPLCVERFDIDPDDILTTNYLRKLKLI